MSKVELPAYYSFPRLPYPLREVITPNMLSYLTLCPYPYLTLPYLTSTLVLHLSIPPIPLFLHVMYAM